MGSITIGVYLWYITCYQICDTKLVIMLNYDNDIKFQKRKKYKSRFSLIVEQIMVFVSSANLLREVWNVSPNFKWIADDVLSHRYFSFQEVDPFYCKKSVFYNLQFTNLRFLQFLTLLLNESETCYFPGISIFFW